ncbi:MAG: hypothetical protein ABIO04_14590 [Ferruginibacter sp.]
MSINRNNYETFFLLYVDNELSASDRKVVDLFVKENEDLQQELQLLLDTTLPEENITFQFTRSLMKEEFAIDSLQESMLLFLDKELDKQEEKVMKQGIASNTDIKKQWEILLQTKLDKDEKMVFENKQVLYSHEKRVVPIRYWRIAAAAAILFAILFTAISVLRKSTIKNAYVSNNNKELPQPITKEQIDDTIVEPSKASPDYNINKLAVTGNAFVKTDEVIKKDIEHSTNNSTARVIDKKQPSANMPVLQRNDRLEKINNDASNKMATASVLKKSNDMVYENKVADGNLAEKNKIPVPVTPLIDYNYEAAILNSYAKNAVLDEVPENNDRILYMSEERINRSKVGVLFRKVKRVIERNTNIKTSNGVRIGGFEIAVK